MDHEELGAGYCCVHVCGQSMVSGYTCISFSKQVWEVGVRTRCFQGWSVLVLSLSELEHIICSQVLQKPSSSPLHSANRIAVSRDDWGICFTISDPDGNPYVNIHGYSTYWLGEHSCDGWCHAALQPPNHTVWYPALKKKRKYSFC